MSWGIPRSAWLDSKVQSLLDAGVTVVCAVGNSGVDVADISPAGNVNVITVGSIDKYDIPSGFNNIAPSDANITTGTGEELDLFAPGENVMTALNTDVNGYQILSGTSFSAPLVAGIATEIASTFATMVPYTQLKDIILSTATKNALLFEDDKFSENQNNLAYLFTSDPNGNYKSNNMTSYLGVQTAEEPIVFDLHSTVDTSIVEQSLNHSVAFSIEFLDPQVEKDYSQFIKVDSVTGMVTIDNITLTLPETDKLKMVEFKGVATTPVMKLESNVLFFFHANPLYKDTMESDVTLALTNTNSISFYAAWSGPIK